MDNPNLDTTKETDESMPVNQETVAQEPTPTVQAEKPTLPSNKSEGKVEPLSTLPVTIVTQATPHRNNTAVAAIVMAVVVCLGLAGIGVMTYLKSQSTLKEDASQATAAQAAQGTQQSNKVQASDLNKVSSDLEASMKTLDDSVDFDTNGLSDAALGLQ